MMNEIERAIQEFEDNLYHPILKPTISDTSKIIALKALQENTELKQKQTSRNVRKPQNEDEKLIIEIFGKDTRFCAKCGIAVDKWENYCRNCGQKLDWSE